AADMVAIPDPTTLIQVPFQKELGFVIGDCYIDGKKVEDSPRWVLKEQIAKAAAKGYVFKTGVEPEFFLLSPGEGLAISDPRDTQAKPCYDAQAMMRRYGLLKEIVDSLNAAGYGVYQCDHEGFGFVTPDDGGDDCFVHVKDNPELDGVDSGGDAVTFDKEWDDRKGKYKGVNCRVLQVPAVLAARAAARTIANGKQPVVSCGFAKVQ
ncbi:unnamed protein product, partial [Prorocentrum cordatum]